MSHWSAPALAACGIGLALCALAASPAAAGSQRVAILPVVVHTASPDPSYVSRGISDMLSARLEQIGGLEVLRVDDPAAATSQLRPALETGRRVRADYVLFGSFTQFGDGASLDVQCAAVDDRAPELERNIFIQSGTVGEIIPQLDQLADKVVRFVVGEGTSEQSGGPRVGSADLAQFEERLENLERAIFGGVAQVELDAPSPEQSFEEVDTGGEQGVVDEPAEAGTPQASVDEALPGGEAAESEPGGAGR